MRAGRSQAEFAAALGVSRSCLSRYESEKLGAPTAVLNHCLGAIAAQLVVQAAAADPLDLALQLSRDTTKHLELVARRLGKAL